MAAIIYNPQQSWTVRTGIVDITGSELNDTIVNGAYPEDSLVGANSIDEYKGHNVRISGNEGKDVILNHGYNVTVSGGAGDDSIRNFGNNVKISGNEGSDKFIISGASENNTITDFTDGEDELWFEQGAITAEIDTYYTKHSVVIKSAETGDTLVRLEGVTSGSSNRIVWYKDDGGTMSTNINWLLANSAITDSDIKTITVTANGKLNNTLNNAIITATTGNNSIQNSGNTITINGGSGDDIITNSGSDVKINGNDGDDSVSNNGAKNVTIEGGKGKDTIFSSGNDVSIFGGDDNDSISNHGSNVTIEGDAGDDSIRNGYYADSSYGASVMIAGGDGNDYLYNRGDNSTINGGIGDDEIHNFGASAFVIGGSGKDEISNTGNSVTIDSGDGNDSVDNLGSNVSINSGDGNDTITNRGTNATNITINSDGGDDSINNFKSNVTIISGDGDDTIYNDGSNVLIDSGTGNDSIHNRAGSNITFNYRNGDGNDTIDGLKEFPTISISGGSYSSVTSGNDVIIKVGDGSITLKDTKGTSLNIIGTYTPDVTPSDNPPDDSGNTDDEPYWTSEDLQTFLKAISYYCPPPLVKLGSWADIFEKFTGILESAIDIANGNKSVTVSDFINLVGAFASIKGDVKSLKGQDSTLWTLAGSGLGGVASWIKAFDVSKIDATEEDREEVQRKIDEAVEGTADTVSDISSVIIDKIFEDNLSALELRSRVAMKLNLKLKFCARATIALVMVGYYGANQYRESIQKYSAEELPLAMTAEATLVDVLVSAIHGGAHYASLDLDDLAFKGLRWAYFKVTGQKPVNSDKDYMEWIGEVIKRGIFGSSSADDTLETDHDGESLYAQGGNDYIRNVFSNVKIYGGDDNDTIFSHEESRRNYLNGNGGRDYIFALDTKSTAIGDSENDILMSSGDGNSISGGEGMDFILLQNVSDNIVNGGSENDIIALENAKKTVIYYAKNDGNDIIFGCDGDDTVHIAGKTEYAVVENGQDVHIKVGNGIITLKDAAGKNVKIENRDNAENPINNIDPFAPNPVISSTVSGIKARAAENIVTNLDSLDDLTANGTSILTFTENSGRGIKNVNLSSSEYPQVVSLEGGHQKVQFNDKDGNVAIVGASATGSKEILFGNGNDLGIFLSPNADIKTTVASGNDSIITDNNAHVHVDMTKADNAKIIPYSGKVILDGYDASTRSAVIISDINNIADAVKNKTIQVADDVLKIDSTASVEFNDSSTDVQFVNLVDADGRRNIFGWSKVSGGVLDGSGTDRNQILQSSGDSTIRGGAKNDIIFAGDDDVVSVSGGRDELRLEHNYGGGFVTIDMGNGSEHSRTEIIDGFKVVDDVIKIDDTGDLKVRVRDDKLTFSKGDALLNFDELKSFSDANGLQVAVGGETYTLRSDYSGGLSSEYFWADSNNRYYKPDTSLYVVDSGEEREYHIGEGSGKATIDGFNFGMFGDVIVLDNADALSYQGDNLSIVNGSDDRVEITDGAGKVLNVVIDGKHYLAEVGANLAYKNEVDYYGNLNGGKGSTVSVGADYVYNQVAVYMNGANELGGKVKNYVGVDKIDASEFSGQASLIGGDLDDTIIAAQGATSLWGGDNGNDVLTGTGSGNEFFYFKGNGNDTIQNATDGDIVNLYDVTLDDISSTQINSAGAIVEFKDGGSITFLGAADATFKLGDGSSWKANHQSNEWNSQA